MSRAADGVWAGMGPRRGREGESEALCRSINTPVTLISNQPRTLKGRRECSGCFFTHVSPDVREGGGGGTGDGGGWERSMLRSMAHSYEQVCALMFIVMGVANQKKKGKEK